MSEYEEPVRYAAERSLPPGAGFAPSRAPTLPRAYRDANGEPLRRPSVHSSHAGYYQSTSVSPPLPSGDLPHADTSAPMHSSGFDKLYDSMTEDYNRSDAASMRSPDMDSQFFVPDASPTQPTSPQFASAAVFAQTSAASPNDRLSAGSSVPSPRPARTSSARPLPQPPSESPVASTSRGSPSVGRMASYSSSHYMPDMRTSSNGLTRTPPQHSQWSSSSRPSFTGSMYSDQSGSYEPPMRQQSQPPALRVDRAPTPPVPSQVTRQGSFSSYAQSAMPISPIDDQFFIPQSETTPLTTPAGTAIYRSHTMLSVGYPSEDPIPEHLNQALLTHIAMFVKDRVPRSEHIRGSIPYANSFTGHDVVNLIQRALSDAYKSDRRTALHAARSLHSQFFFFDVRGSSDLLEDSRDQVYVFPDEDVAGSTPSFDQWEGSSRSPGPPRSASLGAFAELPSSVLTEVTSCYSPFCGRMNATTGVPSACYSYTCPNSPSASLRRQASAQADGTPGGTSRAQEVDNSWAESVSPELVAYIGKHEVERQSAIDELIRGEASLVRELDVLRTDFLEPITESDPPIISPDMQSQFFAEVLLNAFEVREHASAFYEAMLERQREQAPVIQAIGDIVHNAARDWGPAYERYLSESNLALDRVKQERADNPAFDQFMDRFTLRPGTNKQQLEHFLTRITFRVPRYKLLLERILKRAADDNPDRVEVQRALELIAQQADNANQRAAVSEAKLKCRQYHRGIVPYTNTNCLVDLDLLSDERKIVHEGVMRRKPDGTTSGFTDWTELFVIMFDHYLVMTKRRSRGKDQNKYQISRRIIPLELLSATGFDDPPQARPSGFHLRPIGGSAGASNVLPAAGRSTDRERSAYPITFRYLGRRGGVFTLFVDTPTMREAWRTKLIEAIGAREAVTERTKAFELATISDQTFLTRPIAADPHARDQTRPPFGRPTCSISFATPEGHQLVAIGHEDGLWIGLRHDPSSFRLVLHLRSITQVSVLQDFALVLVLADKALYAYPLEALVPSAASAASVHRDKEPQKLSGARDVIFFKAGKVGQRVLVIYVKRSGVSQTVFKALEPISQSDRGPVRGLLGRRRTEWFRTYREFFCPSETFSIIFLRSQLSIVCAKGFELMSLENEPLRMISFPEWAVVAKSDPRAAELQKRCNDSRALAMFRIHEQLFLFCYEDCAFYTDKHGDPIVAMLDRTVDWQGTPRAVAFFRPYILAFDDHFIEVRHAESGRLVQIIRGREVACTWDGQSVAIDTGSGTGESDRRVHVSINLGGKFFTIAELLPTNAPVMR